MSVALEIAAGREPSNAAALRRHARRETAGLLLLAAPILVVIALLLLVPLLWLVGQSFVEADGAVGFGNYARLFVDGSYLRSVALTLEVAAAVTAISAPLAYAVAYALLQMPPLARGLCLALVTLPFWTSALVRTYALLVLLQNRGLVNTGLAHLGLIGGPLPLVYNLTGTLIGMVHVLLPFMLFPLYGAMTRIDPELMRAAAGLGARPLTAFWRVFFPLSLPGLAAGTTLVFIIALGFYITPALLGGGRVIMIAQVIQRDATLYLRWGPAAASAVVFTAAIALLLTVVARTVSLERMFNR